MPIGRLGAIEEYPTTLFRCAGFQPRQTVRLGQAERLREDAAECTCARRWHQRDGAIAGSGQRKRKVPADSGQLASSGRIISFRWRKAQECEQCTAQGKRFAVFDHIDVPARGQQTVAAHPYFHFARSCELVTARVSRSLLNVAAAVERVHEIIEQSELRRDFIFFGQAHEHQHTCFAG